MDEILRQFSILFPEINQALGAGIMIFMRLVGMMRLAPVLSKSEVPAMVRLSFALISTIILVGVIKPAAPDPSTPMFLCMVLNFLFGALIGYIANCILSAVLAGGDMINTQMGLSSAMIMDPSTKSQVSMMANFFSVLAMLIFIYSGGIYWLFNALIRSFELFPMYSCDFHFEKFVNIFCYNR